MVDDPKSKKRMKIFVQFPGHTMSIERVMLNEKVMGFSSNSLTSPSGT